MTFSMGTNKPCRLLLLVFGPTTIDIAVQSMCSLSLAKSYFRFLTWFGGSKGPGHYNVCVFLDTFVNPCVGQAGDFCVTVNTVGTTIVRTATAVGTATAVRTSIAVGITNEAIGIWSDCLEISIGNFFSFDKLFY